jgi:hypothetical protein
MNTREAFQQLTTLINAVVIGQETVVERLLIALLADGHVFREGLPGTLRTQLSAGIDSRPTDSTDLHAFAAKWTTEHRQPRTHL